MIHIDNVSITYGAVTASLANVTCRGVLWQASPSGFLLRVPDVARYLVEDGTSIKIDPLIDANSPLVKYHLGLLPLAALVYQRGMLAFHAAAVCNGQGALLLAGNSGSGKSTLLMALLQKGWKMLADDVAIVGLNENQTPTVYPARPGVALWPESINKLEMNLDASPYCDANRRVCSLPGHFEGQPRPLLGIFCLSVHNKGGVNCEGLSGGARFKAMGEILYNSHVAESLCNKIDYFRCVTAIIQSTVLRKLVRTRGDWSVNTLCDYVQEYSVDTV